MRFLLVLRLVYGAAISGEAADSEATTRVSSPLAFTEHEKVFLFATGSTSLMPSEAVTSRSVAVICNFFSKNAMVTVSSVFVDNDSSSGTEKAPVFHLKTVGVDGVTYYVSDLPEIRALSSAWPSAMFKQRAIYSGKRQYNGNELCARMIGTANLSVRLRAAALINKGTANLSLTSRENRRIVKGEPDGFFSLAKLFLTRQPRAPVVSVSMPYTIIVRSDLITALLSYDRSKVIVQCPRRSVALHLQNYIRNLEDLESILLGFDLANVCDFEVDFDLKLDISTQYRMCIINSPDIGPDGFSKISAGIHIQYQGLYLRTLKCPHGRFNHSDHPINGEFITQVNADQKIVTSNISNIRDLDMCLNLFAFSRFTLHKACQQV